MMSLHRARWDTRRAKASGSLSNTGEQAPRGYSYATNHDAHCKTELLKGCESLAVAPGPSNLDSRVGLEQNGNRLAGAQPTWASRRLERPTCSAGASMCAAPGAGG